MKPLSLILILLSILSAACSSVQNSARLSARETTVRKLLDGRRFRFVPQTMQTQSGRTVQVQTQSLDIRNDTLVSSLPYFGVSRAPELGGGTGPLNFVSTDFIYDSEKRGKKNTFVTVRLNDRFLDAQEFYLDVSSSGYATLRVRFNSRQPVSFYGEVRHLPVRK